MRIALLHVDLDLRTDRGIGTHVPVGTRSNMLSCSRRPANQPTSRSAHAHAQMAEHRARVSRRHKASARHRQRVTTYVGREAGGVPSDRYYQRILCSNRFTVSSRATAQPQHISHCSSPHPHSSQRNNASRDNHPPSWPVRQPDRFRVLEAAVPRARHCSRRYPEISK